jgi:hypothetical protein
MNKFWKKIAPPKTPDILKMNSVTNKLKNDFVPSLVAGGLSVLAYTTLMGHSLSENIEIMGTLLPAWVLVGGITVASDYAGSALEDVVLPLIPNNSNLVGMESALLKPTLSGLAFYGFSRAAFSGDTPFLPSFGLGVGSVIGAEYLNDNFLHY